LEVFIAFVAVGTFRVEINPVIIDLPDFNDCVADRSSCRAKNTTREVRNLPGGRCDGVVYEEQIIIGIGRKFVGVEWTLCLPRSANEFFGKYLSCGEGDSTKGDALEKLPTT
jgi:hypothetical protein